ncbi:MAG: CDP-glucose 4,6-dehydratase [Sediminibacterium sp.]
MVDLDDFLKQYSGKKVFLTGHTGFKGSWMLQILSMYGANVKGYSLPPINGNNLFDSINGNQICESIIADIRDGKKLKDEIISFQPDFIFHFAAQPLVLYSYENTLETYEVNVIGTVNILESLKCLSNKCTAILVTTDKVYKNHEWDYPYRENDQLGGHDPYSASKACSELVIDSYRTSFFHPSKFDQHNKAIAAVRAGNVIGGGDWSENRLIPDIIKSLITNNKLIIRNPGSIRPWQHVLEPIIGYLRLGVFLANDPLKFSTAFNFGPSSNDALNVKQIVELAIDAWGSGTYDFSNAEISNHEAGILKLDISKATSYLGWIPKLDAPQALNLTMDWYKQYYNNKEGVIEFTKNQIFNYISSIN